MPLSDYICAFLVHLILTIIIFILEEHNETLVINSKIYMLSTAESKVWKKVRRRKVVKDIFAKFPM